MAKVVKIAMSNPQTISSGWMSAVLDQLESHGISRTKLTVDLAELHNRSGLPNRQLEIITARRLWHRVAELSEDPLIGMKVGMALPLQATNIISLIMLHSETVSEMTQNVGAFQGLVSNSGFYSQHPTPAGVDMRYTPEPSPVPQHGLQMDSILAGTISLMKKVVGQKFGADIIRLTNANKRLRKAYEEAFECPVEFASRVPGYRLSARTMGLPLPHADPALLEVLLNHARSLSQAQARLDQLGFTVRNAINAHGAHLVSCNDVAAELGLGVRTLQRRLSAAGTTFRRLCEEARMEETHRLLSQTNLSIPELAHRLGYSEASALSRAVYNWFGMRPQQLRKQHSQN
jgi:AraC-like DNA-binding protein